MMTFKDNVKWLQLPILTLGNTNNFLFNMDIDIVTAISDISIGSNWY